MIDRYLIDYHHTQTYADLVEDEDGDYVLYEDHISEIETLRKRLAESDKTSDEHLNARYLAEQRAEKAEAHIVELDRELINIRRSRRKAEAALTEARARLAVRQ